MNKKISILVLSAGFLFASSAFAIIQEPVKKEETKQEDPKKAVQDTTKKKTGTRMAINSAGLPTKGNNNTNKTSNRTVNEPKKEEVKKEEPKK